VRPEKARAGKARPGNPRRGFYVRRFTKEEVLEAFELREILEGLAARRAR